MPFLHGHFMDRWGDLMGTGNGYRRRDLIRWLGLVDGRVRHIHGAVENLDHGAAVLIVHAVHGSPHASYRVRCSDFNRPILLRTKLYDVTGLETGSGGRRCYGEICGIADIILLNNGLTDPAFGCSQLHFGDRINDLLAGPEHIKLISHLQSAFLACVNVEVVAVNLGDPSVSIFWIPAFASY